MRRIAAIAALLLLAACGQQQTTRQPAPSLGVLTNTIRGRCTTILAGDTLRRVCAPRGRAPQPRDSAQVDTAAARAADER